MCFRPSGVQGPDTAKIACPECGKENMNSRKTCFACGAALPKPEAAAFPDAFGAPSKPTAPSAPGAPKKPGAPVFPDAFGSAK